MANEQNLQPGNVNHTFTPEETLRGVRKSAEVRHEKKLWKEEICKRLKEKDFNEVIDNLIERAKNNDKAFEILRDTMGQKPKDSIEIETKLPIFNIEVVDNKELEKKFGEYETNIETD